MPLLPRILEGLMLANVFADFRLVGGTALCLHKGYRMSIDIYLFTGEHQETLDFDMLFMS